MIHKQYHSWRWWIRWFVPYPILLWLSRKEVGRHHIWYQGRGVQLETMPFEHKDYQA